jgi:hypothetical protein
MKVVLKNVRLAFPDLFVAVKIGDDPTSSPRYTAIAIVEPAGENAKALLAAVSQVGAEKWKTKWPAVHEVLKSKDRICYRQGPKANKTGDVYDGFEGMHHVNASNEVKPLVLDRNKSPVSASDGKVYAGCYVNMSVDLWAQDNKWGQRINATLLGVQFVKDGDAFAAGARADPEDFDDLGAGADAEELA